MSRHYKRVRATGIIRAKLKQLEQASSKNSVIWAEIATLRWVLGEKIELWVEEIWEPKWRGKYDTF